MIKRVDSTNGDFLELIQCLDAELNATDGEAHAVCKEFNNIDAIKNVVIFCQAERAVGCGAIRRYSDNTMEVKRMFVLKDYRGAGIASNILKELEFWAVELNYENCILETGQKFSDAIALYKKNGYIQIPNYGQYADIDSSVCFGKKLRL